MYQQAYDVIAIAVYTMPIGQAVDSALLGVVFGLFPIMWIVWNAIWIYNMTEATGHFAVLCRSFGRISNDQRVQAVIIAFCFGALLEAQRAEERVRARVRARHGHPEPADGGVLGKMTSPQNLAIGAAAVGLGGREGELFRRVLGWSLILLLIMCVLVYLQSTPVLSWMVV